MKGDIDYRMITLDEQDDYPRRTGAPASQSLMLLMSWQLRRFTLKSPRKIHDTDIPIQLIVWTVEAGETRSRSRELSDPSRQAGEQSRSYKSLCSVIAFAWDT